MKLVLSILIIFLFSFFSFNASLYWFLIPITGIRLAYIVDQLLPFVIALSISFFLIKRKKNVFDFLKSHYFLLILLTFIAFFVHKEILGFYFYSEGPHTVLFNTMGNPNVFIYGLRGYPFAMYVASFLLFWTNAWAYNLVTLILYILVALSFYVLLHALTSKKLPSFVGAIFFITIPSYLTMFVWQHDAPGMLAGLLSGIFCLLFLLFYQKEKNTGMYLLSLLFYVAATKIGFGRTAGFIALPLFLLFLPIYDVKINLKKSILLSLPYIAICFLYLLLVFFIPDNVFGKIISGQTAKIAPRSAPLYFNNYFFTLSAWIAYLFLPNQLAKTLYLLIGQTIRNVSISSLTVIAGMASLIAMLAATIVSFFHLKKKEARLVLFSVLWILCNVFFVPLLVFDYHNLSIIDRDFTSINPGSAPGSKYVFYSSMGLSIMIAVFTLLAKKQSKQIFYIWMAFLIMLITYYVTLSKTYYRLVLDGTPSVKEIPDKVFSMVPRNGKKKLLFSSNPIRSALDTPSPEWPNSFYSENEIFYTHDKSLVEQLTKKGKYKKENVFAFYNNPVTLAFADVSELLRDELFPANKPKNDVSLLKDPGQMVSKLIPSTLGDANYQLFIQRGVFTSPDLSNRFVLPKTIKLSIQKNKQAQFQFPYLDAIILETNKHYVFPQELWSYAKNPPLVFKKEEYLKFLTLPSFNNTLIHAINLQDKMNITDILKERELIRLGTTVSVSEIYNNPKVQKESLIDGLFTNDPVRDDQYYYNAITTNPVKITLNLPYETVLGRVLLNVPPRNPNNAPENVQIYSIKDKRELIGSLETTKPSISWSPNKGMLYSIPIKQITTNAIEIDIQKTAGTPLLLDEIIMDPPSALAYSPEKIYTLGNLTSHYVNNDILLNTLQTIRQFNSLTALYACAEDKDWKMEKEYMKSNLEPTPNVWKAYDIPMDAGKENEELTFPVDCYGSVLRKIIIVAPPTSDTIKIDKIYLK